MSMEYKLLGLHLFKHCLWNFREKFGLLRIFYLPVSCSALVEHPQVRKEYVSDPMPSFKICCFIGKAN